MFNRKLKQELAETKIERFRYKNKLCMVEALLRAQQETHSDLQVLVDSLNAIVHKSDMED